eukprot:gene9263-biopygen15077
MPKRLCERVNALVVNEAYGSGLGQLMNILTLRTLGMVRGAGITRRGGPIHVTGIHVVLWSRDIAQRAGGVGEWLGVWIDLDRLCVR